MLLEFITFDALLDYRSWRPEQPSQLLGVPDAMLMTRGEEPELAFLRWRVEAAETTIAFRAHEDRPEKMGPSFNTFDYVLREALDAAHLAWLSADNAQPQAPEPTAKPIFRLDNSDYFRCCACGEVTVHAEHFTSYKCRGALSAPFRVEQHRWGYRVANRNGLRLADLFHAYWALPLAIALTGRPLAAFDGARDTDPDEDAAAPAAGSRPHLRVVPDIDTSAADQG